MELPERPTGIITLEDDQILDEMRVRIQVIVTLGILAAIGLVVLAVELLADVEGVARWIWERTP